MSERLLTTTGLHTGYDGVAVVRDLTMHVDAGEVVFERSFRRYEERLLQATLTLEPGKLTIAATSDTGRKAVATVVFDEKIASPEPVDLILR